MRRLITVAGCAALLAAVLLGTACGGGGPATPTQPTATKMRTVVLIEGMTEELASHLAEGVTVRIRDTKGVLGTIESIETTAARESVETADGRIVFSTIPDRFDLRVSIVGDATYSEAGARFGGEPVYANDELKLVTQLAYVRGRVVSIGPAE